MLSTRLTSANSSSPGSTKLSDYFKLTKPGITFTAGITAVAGFVLSSQGDVDLVRLLHTAMGTLLIAAGAGTLNMVIEKDIDARMKRTQKRPLPSGRLKAGEALFLGTLLSGLAIVYLAWMVNILTAAVAGFTLSVYLYIYTPLKKVTSLCTFVGAVAGALPPVMGWTAATGRIGWEALVLFGILFFWQFPHFFSLAWLYKDDYQQAGLHMLPRIQDNGTATAIGMLLSSLALLGVSLMPTFMNLTGYFYLTCAVLLGVWLTIGSFLFYKDRSHVMARKLFFASLAYVPILVVAMVLKI
ncbi:protoheme IX farnesyltransferase [bacterium F11]|nr:protoheme IX farnesyltransferase [bacterium F11]